MLNRQVAHVFYAMSAFFASGGLGYPDPLPPITWRERWLVRAELALTALGLPVGTDGVAVFRRAPVRDVARQGPSEGAACR